MLVQIGRRAQTEDVVELLAECHARIRRFVDLANTLASSTAATPAEIRDVAAQIVRYFTSAFPLHVADEEETILPRLRDRADLAPILARMHEDHVEHEHLTTRLVTLCEALVRDPGQLAASARSLAETAERLAVVLEAHLSFEEIRIFPVLRALPATERAAIHDEMRMRRDVALGVH